MHAHCVELVDKNIAIVKLKVSKSAPDTNASKCLE